MASERSRHDPASADRRQVVAAMGHVKRGPRMALLTHANDMTPRRLHSNEWLAWTTTGMTGPCGRAKKRVQRGEPSATQSFYWTAIGPEWRAPVSSSHFDRRILGRPASGGGRCG